MNTYQIRTFNFDAARTWLTADTHFCHAEIIARMGRPFASAAEMDTTLVRNLHDCVGPEDTLIHLGDLTTRHHDRAAFDALPGRRKYLVRGNHDLEKTVAAPWTMVMDTLDAKFTLPDGGRVRVILNHYPMVSWAGAHRTLHLHGHSHGRLPPMVTEAGGRLDVGVDAWNFRPIRLADALGRLAGLRALGVTHHAGKDY